MISVVGIECLYKVMHVQGTLISVLVLLSVLDISCHIG